MTLHEEKRSYILLKTLLNILSRLLWPVFFTVLIRSIVFQYFKSVWQDPGDQIGRERFSGGRCHRGTRRRILKYDSILVGAR